MMINERQLKIFNLLFTTNKKYLPAKEIASLLEVSSKTIFSDLVVIADLLSPHHVNIEKKPRYGLKLQGKETDIQNAKKVLFDLYETNHLNEFSPHFRRKEIFKQLFIYGKPLSLQEFSQQYYVSKTAILNDIEIISFNIKGHNIEIKTINKLVTVVGKEESIQTAAVAFLLNDVTEENTKTALIDYFDKNLYVIVFDAYSKIKQEYFSKLSDFYNQSLFITLAVQVFRVKNANHAKIEQNQLFKELTYLEYYPLSSEILSSISEEAELVFNEEDIQVLSRQLYAHRVQGLVPKDKEFGNLINLLIKRFEIIEGISLPNKDELQKQLLSHIPPMMLRLSKRTPVKNPLLDEIKNRNLPLFTVTWYVLSIIEQNYDLVLNDDEVSFVTIYFQMAINQSVDSHNILVLCPYGIASSQFILNQLRKVLPRNERIRSIGISQFKEIDLTNVDLIISTTNVMINAEVPIITVTPYLGNDDYSKIFDFYAHVLFKKKYFKTNHADLYHIQFPELKKCISERDIFLNMEMKNKEECLDFLISQFELKDYVTQDFRNSILSRERLGNTELENGVSLPHGAPETSKKLCVSIMTLKKPVKWNTQFVDIIVILSVPEAKIDSYRDIVLDVYKLIGNKENVVAIKEIKYADQLMNIINK